MLALWGLSYAGLHMVLHISDGSDRCEKAAKTGKYVQR